MVSKCKEKVTLTPSLPYDVKEVDQTKTEVFNFKEYPAVWLFEALNGRRNLFPIKYTM